MEGIVEKIIDIDSQAFSKKNENEELLSKKKQEYEDIILAYKNEKISIAAENSQSMVADTDKFIKINENKQKDEILNISKEISKKYVDSKNELLKKIFNKLFVMEG